MHRFLGIVRCEYGMSIRRRSFWLAFGLLLLFYVVSIASGNTIAGRAETAEELKMWQTAGQMAFMLNLFLPVIAGISAADRLVRDQRTGVIELLRSTPISRWTYILGKYVGVVLSSLTPIFLFMFGLSMYLVVRYAGPASFIGMCLLAFLAINVPAYVFVTAFSLACPLVMPLRVYQVLFTGYWFWGNYVNPAFIPSLSGTLLTPGGKIPLGAWFGMRISNAEPVLTPLDGVLNLALLALCAGLALFALERILAWRWTGERAA